MKIPLGKATGLDLIRTDVYRGFLLMIRGWEVSYVHYLEEFLGIAWSRTLIIGEYKWWFTESWTLWAKKTPKRLQFALKR